MNNQTEDPKDIALAYQLGANSYAVKPLDAEVRRRLVHGLKLSWIECNRRPEVAFSERAEGARGNPVFPLRDNSSKIIVADIPLL